MKNLNHEFKTNVRKPALFLVCLFLLSVVMFSFAACGSDPADTSSSDDVFSSDEGIAAPSDENGVISDESDVVVTNSDGVVISGNSEDGSSSAGTGSSSGKKPSSGNSSNSSSSGSSSSGSSSNSGSSHGGNSGSSNNTKPTNPTNPTNPTKPSEPTSPSEPEVPVLKDSFTRMPEVEKLMWNEINRRRVAGGLPAFKHCNTCEATANKQAQFNAEYLIFEEMSIHGPHACGTVTWYASGKESNKYIAQHLVDNWWNSAGHKANFMDPGYKNGGIAVYKVVQNGVIGYVSIFHFDGDDAFGCSDTTVGADYINKYYPDAWYKK